jgi:hypothetical protein
MLDARNNTLRLGDMVAVATTTIPGRSTHAILRLGTVKKIAMGKSGEYIIVQVVEDSRVSSVPVREPRKLIRLESAK